ncbi:hypothetical protein CHIBA101_1050 [Actinomyces sp. Chiba101]|nr:hypothetical protein CHIBA101_1050 [Actinomyces sp. Chiba101]GAV94103.1 hypothetical protein ADENT20671_0871 [Actinomyces denticolens]
MSQVGGHLVELLEARPPRGADADENDRDATCPDSVDCAGKLFRPSIGALAALLSLLMHR